MSDETFELAPPPQKQERTLNDFSLVPGMSSEECARLAQTTLIMSLYRAKEGFPGDLVKMFATWAVFGGPFLLECDNFGGFIDTVRNGMVKKFLMFCADHPEIDKLIMIDNDEGVPPDAPFRLAAWDVPVVSGVVCSHNSARGIFACFTVKDEHGVARFPSHNFTKVMPGKGLVQAHSVGTGLICVKKHVFETMYERGMRPFAIPEEQRIRAEDTGLLAWGEDIAFSRRCEELGIPIYVDTSVHAPHFKTLPLTWPRDGIDFDLSPEDWRVSPKDYRHG